MILLRASIFSSYNGKVYRNKDFTQTNILNTEYSYVILSIRTHDQALVEDGWIYLKIYGNLLEIWEKKDVLL